MNMLKAIGHTLLGAVVVVALSVGGILVGAAWVVQSIYRLGVMGRELVVDGIAAIRGDGE